MRIFIFMLAMGLVASATAQEPQPLWEQVRNAFSKIAAPQQPIEPIDQLTGNESPTDSPEAQRQALWESATKLTGDDGDDTTASTQPTVTSPRPKDECLDPALFQPGQVGHLDYYLFKVVDTGSREVYLEGEQSKEPFCLTGVDAEDLEATQHVVILGNVRVRGTKSYKTKNGNNLKVRVVKLLSPEESELADAERAFEHAEHPIRTWTSKNGKFKIEAGFVKFAGGKVHLVNSEGKTLTVSPNDLSLEDREYYRGLVKKARDARRKAAEAEKEEEQALTTEEAPLR